MARQNHPISLDESEQILYNRILDLARQAKSKGSPRFTAFLDQRQQAVALYAVQTAGECQAVFFGGEEGSERKVLGLGSDDFVLNQEMFPIKALTLGFPKDQKLSHRDFLGALMGLMIKRELIGDILISEGKGLLYVLNPAAALILSELTKAGRTAVSCTEGKPADWQHAASFEEISGTVSSLRLDCIVSHLLNLSRESSDKLIAASKVMNNARVITDGAKQVSQGDIISIRGYGKYIIDEVGARNKKGRIRIYCKKYA